MPSRLAAALGAVVLAVTVVVPALPAQAHNYLVASTPAADSTVTELPAVFSVTTNEALLDLSGNGAGFAIQVTDAAGRYYGDGCVSIVDATLSVGATLGEPGDYTLLWQLISEDGHPVSGEFAFAWAPPAGAATTAGVASPPDCGGAAHQNPAASAPPETRPNASLGDVLWIGGAIAAILVAGLVTFLVLGRRKRS